MIYNINSDSNTTPISCTVEDLQKILISKGRLKAPGYDMLRFEHVKALFAVHSNHINDSIQAYRECLSKIINMIISGNLPPGAASFIRGINLSALLKKEGSDDIRPIGLQILYRKIAASVINSNKSFRDFTSKYFANIQYCLSDCGSEKIAHCLQAIVDSNCSQDIFTPDASNAFNSLNIKCALYEVKKNFPSALPFLRQIYGSSSTAWYEVINNSNPTFTSVAGIQKEEGVDQGCSSASFMYSIGIHPLLQKISTIIGDEGFVKFFADDGNIVTSTTKMISIINLLSSAGPAKGYLMNKTKGTYLMGKCSSYEEAIHKKEVLTSLNFVPPESILIHPSNLDTTENKSCYGTVAVGTPVGTDAFIKRFLDSKIDSLNMEADKIISIPDPQAKHLILKHSFSQKISFLLRTLNPYLTGSFISKFTEIKRRIFSSIIESPVPDIAWDQCSLPTSMGGLGYGNLTLSSIASSIASIYESRVELSSLVNLGLVSKKNLKKFDRCRSSLEKFNSLTNPNPSPDNPIIKTWADLTSIVTGKSLQSALMSRFKQFSLDSFQSKLAKVFTDQQTLRKKMVYFSSLSGELSSQWLNKCPTKEEFTLTPDQFRVLIARRIMVPIHTYTVGSKCSCGTFLDDSGTHITSSCNKDSSLHIIHNSVLRSIDKAARSQGLNSTLELSSFSSDFDNPSEKRPDITITNWPQGKSLKVIDLAITNPVSPTQSYIQTPSALDPERLLKKREIQKINKYRPFVVSKGGEFDPLVIGTSGNITSTTKKLLQVMCSPRDSSNSKLSRCVSDYWMNMISFTLHKTIASQIIIQSTKFNGRHSLSPYAASSFPDSTDIHFDMNG